MILVTGGAGFIGANFVLDWMAAEGTPVVTLDKLTYAGNRASLASLEADRAGTSSSHGDICDSGFVGSLLREHAIDAVMHLAAESHVDRSIDSPEEFIQTNFVGTYRLLEAARLILERSAIAYPKSEVPACFDRRGVRFAGDRRIPRSARRLLTRRTALTAPPRRAATIWRAPTTTPTACRWSRPTARTTTGPISFRKNCCR